MHILAVGDHRRAQVELSERPQVCARAQVPYNLRAHAAHQEEHGSGSGSIAGVGLIADVLQPGCVSPDQDVNLFNSVQHQHVITFRFKCVQFTAVQAAPPIRLSPQATAPAGAVLVG